MSIESTFDVLFNNFFGNTGFLSLDSRIGYPADVYETEDGLTIEIAAVGLDKKDIAVEIKNDTLHVFYKKNDSESENSRNYLYRGITRKSFDLGWKIASCYNLNDIKVVLDKGMLSINIPATRKSETVKKIEIK